MSWGEYLVNLKKEGLAHAAICAADGASWIQVSVDGVREFQGEITELQWDMPLVWQWESH